MPYRIISPTNSFIQFNESGNISSCEFLDINLCIPVFEDTDIAFQFVIESDTPEESEALCQLGDPGATIAISGSCVAPNLLTFSEFPDRFRLSGTQVLYNWPHGVPNFKNVTNIGDCFFLKVQVLEGISFCSNCLQRIGDDCHTSVIEYGNDEDAFGFNYCNSVPVNSNDTVDCEPMFVTFTNVSTLNIPYTAEMLAKYGNVPTIKTWLYNGPNLENQQIYQALDNYPPTNLKFDFGGPASGVIKISR